MDGDDGKRLTELSGYMLTVFQAMREDDDLRSLVFVFAEDGAAVGMTGFTHEREAFGLALQAMSTHATNEMLREAIDDLQRVTEARAQRPQG